MAMLGGECSACCGGGSRWVCIECETITPSGYSTETFSDGCWSSYLGTDGSTNPLTFSTGYIARCLAINNDGDFSITITASIANELQRRDTIHVAIGAMPDSFSPFGAAPGDYAVSGFGIGAGSDGSDRIQHFSGSLTEFADGVFAGTFSATFSRRSGRWYVSTPGLGESPFNFNMQAGGRLFHGVQGTNGKKVVSGYSITVS